MMEEKRGALTLGNIGIVLSHPSLRSGWGTLGGGDSKKG